MSAVSQSLIDHSRQRKWQLQRKSRNLCSICGDAPIHRDERCLHHYTVKMLRKEGFKKLDPKLLGVIVNQLRNERNHWRRYWERVSERNEA